MRRSAAASAKQEAAAGTGLAAIVSAIGFGVIALGFYAFKKIGEKGGTVKIDASKGTIEGHIPQTKDGKGI
ncbi:MAG: hypothetical protein IPP14_01370 [Planctomycetes bacterium]|nr:hypothetical protein [Planctomycetota bacterium]